MFLINIYGNYWDSVSPDFLFFKPEFTLINLLLNILFKIYFHLSLCFGDYS